MMKRAVMIVIAGLLAAAVGYCALYYRVTKEHREMMRSSSPELMWLKKEFRLGDAEFDRVMKLHEGYLSGCAELCGRIAQKNAELQTILAATNVDAKAVEQKIHEAGDVRLECQKNMFNHFLGVSRQMPPEQGRRYLQWVQQRTLAPGYDMARQHEMTHH